MKETDVRRTIDTVALRALDVLDRPLLAPAGSLVARVQDLAHHAVCLVTDHHAVDTCDCGVCTYDIVHNRMCTYCNHVWGEPAPETE